MCSYSRDSLGFSAIARPPNGLHELPTYMCPHPRDSLGFSTILRLPNGLHELPTHMSTYSRDSLGFAPILRLPNGLHEQHSYRSCPSRDSLGFAPISTPPNGLHELLQCQMCKQFSVLLGRFVPREGATFGKRIGTEYATRGTNIQRSVSLAHWEELERDPQCPSSFVCGPFEPFILLCGWEGRILTLLKSIEVLLSLFEIRLPASWQLLAVNSQ